MQYSNVFILIANSGRWTQTILLVFGFAFDHMLVLGKSADVTEKYPLQNDDGTGRSS